MDIVWDAGRRDAPALKPLIEHLLEKLEGEPERGKTPPKPKKTGRKKKGGA
ncbi:MAG: hypothetical protein KatS3mg105_3157 [Gemmatales bacterium]|nr:MAG: hypothetical protein KatS3mg105_3157 [Gemmatales bacterium]